MAKVFISYVHEDEEVARAVQGYLTHHLDMANDVFMIGDQYRVLAGGDWLQRIKKELSSATVVILMMSGRSVSRPWVNFEAGAGWIMGKTLISVCYGSMTKGDLPKPYSNFTALDLRTEQQFLLRSVAAAVGKPDPALSALSEVLLDQKKPDDPLRSFAKTMRSASTTLLGGALGSFKDNDDPPKRR